MWEVTENDELTTDSLKQRKKRKHLCPPSLPRKHLILSNSSNTSKSTSHSSLRLRGISILSLTRSRRLLRVLNRLWSSRRARSLSTRDWDGFIIVSLARYCCMLLSIPYIYMVLWGQAVGVIRQASTHTRNPPHLRRHASILHPPLRSSQGRTTRF